MVPFFCEQKFKTFVFIISFYENQKKMKYTVIALISFMILVTACQSSKPPKDAKMVELGSKHEQNGKKIQLANFTLLIDQNWENETPSNNMRIAQFKVKNSPDFPVVVSYFGDMENKTEANLSRWKNQFSKIESYTELTTKIEGITAVKIIGTYKKKPFPMAQNFVDEPGYGSLAAILPSNEGPYFLKLTAPSAIIDEQEEAFVNVLNTYQKKL